MWSSKLNLESDYASVFMVELEFFAQIFKVSLMHNIIFWVDIMQLESFFKEILIIHLAGSQDFL